MTKPESGLDLPQPPIFTDDQLSTLTKMIGLEYEKAFQASEQAQAGLEDTETDVQNDIGGGGQLHQTWSQRRRSDG